MSMRRVGDWGRVSALVKNISRDLDEARQIGLKRIGLFAEAAAVKHLSRQDLNWQPLKAATITAKVRRGESEKTLIATSFYFQSITSWVHRDTALVGVKRTARDKKGNVTADIARVHEFGSPARNIPARPLWKPVLKETLAEMNKSRGKINPANIYLELIKRKYGI